MRGSHSFNSLKNDGFHTLLQQLVNIAGKHGSFDVKDVLDVRKTYLHLQREGFGNKRIFEMRSD